MKHFIERPTCPACGSPMHTAVVSIPFSDQTLASYVAGYWRKSDPSWFDDAVYEPRLCNACGCVFQLYIPDNALLAEVYGTWLVDQSDTSESSATDNIETHPRYSKAAHELFALATLTGRRISQMSILDYGYGWGSWLSVAKRLGAQVSGTEVGEDRLNIGRRLGFDVFSPDDPLPEAAFDIIHTEQVFEHLPNPRDTLRTLAKSLKPGGVVYVSVPRDDHLIAKLQQGDAWVPGGPPEAPFHEFKAGPLHSLHPFEHLNCFSHRALKRLAESAGLDVRPVRTYQRLSFVMNGGIPWRHPKQLAKSFARSAYERIRRDNQIVIMSADR